jgi:hypothetical protein
MVRTYPRDVKDFACKTEETLSRLQGMVPWGQEVS